MTGLIERYFTALNARDWPAFAALLAPDLVYDIPQSGERVRGPENLTRFNREFPGDWTIHLRRQVADEARGAAEIGLEDAGAVVPAAIFFEFERGLIRHITDYWPEPFGQPAFRATWDFVERV